MLGIVAAELDLLPDDAPQLSAVVLTAYLLYCSLLESSRRQATLGKIALGLKVTGLHGERIGFGRAVARFVARLLSVLTLCLGYLSIVVTKRRQGLHDLIAGTLVAYDATPRRPAWLVAGVSAGALVPLLAVLSGAALPAYRDYAIRTQVTEGLDLAGEYRKAIEAAVAQRASRLRGSKLGLRRPRPAAQRPIRRIDRGRVRHDRHQLRRRG